MNHDEVLLGGYEPLDHTQRKSKWYQDRYTVLLGILLTFQVITLGIAITASYKVHGLDVETVNYDSQEVAKILSDQGTEKIIQILENMNMTDYGRYVDKVRHIIDDACYYIFNCYDTDQIGFNQNLTKVLSLATDRHLDRESLKEILPDHPVASL